MYQTTTPKHYLNVHISLLTLPMKNNKDLLAQKFLDLANLSIATLIFGQIISEQVNRIASLTGFGLFIFLHYLAYLFKKE